MSIRRGGVLIPVFVLPLCYRKIDVLMIVKDHKIYMILFLESLQEPPDDRHSFFRRLIHLHAQSGVGVA